MILSKYNADNFLMQSVIDICHPQSEYFPDKSTQSEHPVGPKFKIKQFIQLFFDRATPVTHKFSFSFSLMLDVYGLIPDKMSQ
jgi:hypothetical protein